ncbi:phenylalanine--tRNA ligase subunit alpha [candidate division WOR-3 bacterium JGI_Cruoil_03_44_89]|uniref:Phenylalanine--tRNA ligase alpha subunit n=1 Tax=candidate division WOR-3 bacterium JGI_Cruoil_03_44_89 TaxID=1973748 RepID=A0A235BXF4_UNCW3|nr:MAG: phenylalanine--tRNA ligase subunit alpha [candidate division WOR-3 bacterium JGI_Cruoil_03_44_89]
MLSNLREIRHDALSGIARASSLQDIEKMRVSYLGRKGKLTEVLKGIGGLEKEERKLVGKSANEIKKELEKAISEKKKKLEGRGVKGKDIDITLPGRTPWVGRRHPITICADEICDIFTRIGYSLVEGPEIETEYYNFEALNIPEYHPARDVHDTFYLEDGRLLRTQTTNVEVRVMERGKPPLKIISWGKCYRRDSPDATHSPVFHQLEGFYVDRNVTFRQLKGTLIYFAKQFFGEDIKTKFVPSYFPFTEPSAELYISCSVCRGKGCRVCKHTGYVEVLGCGMLHPNVFRNVGYDPGEYTGFAFGMGLERLTMLKYKIDDIRLFYENDIRFLNQFGP